MTFVNRLLGNRKWHQRWHFEFSNQYNKFQRVIFKSVEAVYKQEYIGYLKKRALEEPRFIFLYSVS